jgi:[ribosomal protein S18]-alanine N-acetyltransferase
LKIRPALGTDAAAIADIEATGETPSWTEAAVRATLAMPTTRAFVVEREGAVAGHLLAAVVLDEAEVLIVAVHPAWRRRGLGRTLLAAAVADWRGAGVSRAFLDVRADNGAARALYAAAGWSEIGRRAGYYADGADAVVLELQVGAGASGSRR